MPTVPEDKLITIVIFSEALEFIDAARNCIQEMQKVLPVEDRETSSAPVVGALLTVCLQHCDSMLILAKTGSNDASIEALFRPAVESAFRLVWLCEKEDRAYKITKGEVHFPGLSQLMRRTIKGPIHIDGNHTVTHLHELAHAGIAQLKQHFREERLKRKDSERPIVLVAVGLLAMFLAWLACLSFCSFNKRMADVGKITAIFNQLMAPASKVCITLLSSTFPPEDLPHIAL